MKKLRFVHRTIFADNSTIYSLYETMDPEVWMMPDQQEKQ